MRARRVFAGLAVLPLLATWMQTASADDISNNIDATVDATAEVMSLNVSGANGSTELYVIPTGDGPVPEDGKNGCNLTGKTTLGLTVSSSNTTVATVSPSNVTFTKCGDVKTLTVTPLAQGSATISVTQTSNDTNGTFNLAPATFTVNVGPAAPANTAPSIAIAGVTAGASYAKGVDLSPMCEVTDAEDSPLPFLATLTGPAGPYASDGIGEVTASCSYTDVGGLSADSSVTYSIIDPSAPSIGYTLDPATPDGANGWYKGDVSLTWAVAEPESPNSLQKTDCVDQPVIADQAATSYSCSATSAGGTAHQETVTVQRDGTAPAVALLGGPSDGASYYFGSVPEAPTCNASDALSGLDGSCVVSGYSDAVGEHTVKATVKDVAGNSTEVAVTYNVLAWDLQGFYAPVDMSGVWNTVKGGSTVPLKFEAFAAGEVTSTKAIKSFTQRAVTCPGSAATTDDVEITTTGGTSLRYDSTGGQFIQNWQTPKNAGACYTVTMTTQDGSLLSANFKLK